jgi:hypothetical protein
MQYVPFSLNEGSYGCVVGILPSFLLPNAQNYVGKVLKVTLLSMMPTLKSLDANTLSKMEV